MKKVLCITCRHFLGFIKDRPTITSYQLITKTKPISIFLEKSKESSYYCILSSRLCVQPDISERLKSCIVYRVKTKGPKFKYTTLYAIK